MGLTFTISGIDEAAAYVSNLAQTIKPNLIAAVDTIFTMAESQAYRDCPVITGYLRSTIQKQSGGGATTLASITVSAPYAGIVNFGYGNRQPKPYATNAYNFILSELKRINIANK